MVETDVFCWSMFDIASTGPVGVSLSCSSPKVDILEMQVTPSKPEIKKCKIHRNSDLGSTYQFLKTVNAENQKSRCLRHTLAFCSFQVLVVVITPPVKLE